MLKKQIKLKKNLKYNSEVGHIVDIKQEIANNFLVEIYNIYSLEHRQ